MLNKVTRSLDGDQSWQSDSFVSPFDEDDYIAVSSEGVQRWQANISIFPSDNDRCNLK